MEAAPLSSVGGKGSSLTADIGLHVHPTAFIVFSPFLRPDPGSPLLYIPEFIAGSHALTLAWSTSEST